MLTATAVYKTAIRGSHSRRTRVDVYDALGNVRALDVPIIDGHVDASLTSRVSRTASLTLSEEWFPDTFDDVFSPERAVLRIRSGIRYPDGSEELFPVFTGRVTDASLSADGTVSIDAADRALDVVDFRFEAPRNSEVGISTLTQIERLIAECVAGAVFGPHDVTDAPVPQLTWDEDRGQAVDDLASALGGRWYSLGDGTFVVRAFPYDDGTVLQTVDDGPEGLATGAQKSRSRNGVVNSVTVVSERMDGTDPVRSTQRNTVAGSATEYGDLFGRVSIITKVQTPLTNAEAQVLARGQLNSLTALQEQWSVSMVPDHSLEPGDTVRLAWRGRSAVQVIDSLTYPLTLGAMSIQTRAFTTPPVTLET